MQNNNHRNVILFLILVVLIVIAFLIARNDKNVVVAPTGTLSTNQIYSNQDVLDEEDLSVPEPAPAPIPEDPKITFLKTFFKYEDIIPEIRECERAGIDFTAVTYDGGGIADGGWTIYETNTHEVTETCGGFTPEPMPENSFCRTTLLSCTTVFKEGVVDIYNLD